MALSVKKSCKLIADLSTHVKIKKSGIEKLTQLLLQKIEDGELSKSNFSQQKYHPKSSDPYAAQWILIVDTLNFCFWSFEDAKEKYTVNGETGYFALCAAVNRGLDEKIDILNPKYYSTITENQLKHILRSDTSVTVPLLKERVDCLHQVGSVLLEKFDGSFESMIKSSNGSALKLLEVIVENFECFRDETTYKGNKVALYKRAQILIGDLWACFDGKDLGCFEDIDEITMFADYRVPQSLLYYDVLEYSEELMKRLKNNDILKFGDEMEVEIRGCSVQAVEDLKECLKKKTKQEINSIIIDHYLWDFRRKVADEIVEKGLPFHKTYSIFY